MFANVVFSITEPTHSLGEFVHPSTHPIIHHHQMNVKIESNQFNYSHNLLMPTDFMLRTVLAFMLSGKT